MIKNRKIAIFGFAKEGLAAANYLGTANKIAIFDDAPSIKPGFLKALKIKNADIFVGGKFLGDINFDYVIRSPGIRPDHPNIIKLIKKGAILTSATKIFFDEAPCEIIGVTGTKGKGTTATLIYKMLATFYDGVYLAGNIGTPALKILPGLSKKSIVILELSSFQLIDLKKSPHIAVILMITQEHLNWHEDIDEYQRAKESIVKYQNYDDFAVINQDFKTAKSFAEKTKAKVYFVSTKESTNGVYVKDGKIISAIGGMREEICSVLQVALLGVHNLQNAAAACAVGKIKGVPTGNIAGIISSFKGLIHRLQLIGEINGVKFYNDSFSTVPETTIAAIDSFQNPKILILGGSSKNSDFGKLADKISKDETIKSIILIGQEALRIRKAIEKAGGTKTNILAGADNMAEIVRLAISEAGAGDVVLLSPACASFDMFKNYEDRGEQFVKQVRLWKTKTA